MESLILNNIQKKVIDLSFQIKHKGKIQDFSRKIKLTFPILLLFQLQKGLKSLQLRLNELSMQFPEDIKIVSKSAYTQARQKLRYTAFQELDDVIKDIFYASEEVKYWHGYRLLSIDGSRLILPNTKEILKEYGGQRLPETKEYTADILLASKFTGCVMTLLITYYWMGY